MAIKVENICVGYGEKNILEQVSVSIPKGKFTMIIGPNGCGKSTLLKTISQILPVSLGNIQIAGRDASSYKTKELAQTMALLPQSPFVPEGVSVEELVGYGRFPYQRRFAGNKKEDLEIIEWAMRKTGVYEIRHALVEELSGGQRQRVFIAMALAQKTDILLLDEPTTYLDIAHQLEILSLLHKLNQEEQVSIVAVIHDINHACKFGDHIIGMKKGKVVFAGAPEEVIQEENLKQLYEIQAVLTKHKEKNYPICVDYELLEKAV